ncbi:EAL domain-containing protein (putative c-di-GMP-specific phosphodiesterase class I)/GGDEF domain-containing protein [Oceanisphaera litoralis]|uniref:bifunctional diguanylate cyclase/phosphodiesterase n=1 Tax=Oceanisphaera litoralis TaxID=225144 RepID=UPI001957BA13|nr:LapD/MoxY N-terminal periplasmic domain-containing protein [Oceanisphaera litoralis]MBM7454835.1 EAL domain-containing protein (putative c-di-GMP-specific phosphodiesterase class I)/GGDEF domain-containing protein [Oceanisphaera litoralis]
MTLYRQLLVTMLLLFFLLFMTAYSVQFGSTRSYLAQQQETTVINTATSLGLALAPYLETGDTLGAESVINAVFDGGFYRKVQLDLLATGQQISREHLAPPLGVPDWFVNLGLFEGEKHEAVLTSGWLQLGQLHVEGHPGQAYYQLWQGMSRLATWFLVCFVLVWGLLILALRYLLKPLHDIEVQAREIEQHHFGKAIPLPNTRELRELVSAINKMSGKLEVQFKEQADEAERLRNKAFLDETSGLGNRAYFVSRSQSWLSDGAGGAVLLIAVDMLEQLYRDEGFDARDQMVKAIADHLHRLCRRFGEYALARISAYEYALLVPESDAERLSLLGDEINRLIADLVINPVNGRDISVVGGVLVQSGDDIGLLLTSADNALNKARMSETGAVVIEYQQEANRIGRLARKKILEEALAADGFELSSQAVLDFKGQRYHEELYIGIRHDGISYSAGQFLPVAEQFNMGERLDLHIVQRALRLLAERPELRLAVNLTAHSCHQAGFWQELGLLLDRHVGVCSRLFLDVPESAFAFGRQVVTVPLSSLNVAWGIDHFGRHFDLLTRMGGLAPHYVKLDHGYTSQVAQPGYDDAFLAAVCRAAHNMGAMTIATRVETDRQVDILKTLHVDAYQGFVSPPTRLD